MTSYKDSPEHQKEEGDRTEWQTMHLLQDIGDFTCIPLQQGKSEAALIYWPDRKTISPDALILRGPDRFFVEIKAKTKTRHNTYGYKRSTIRQYERLAIEHNIEVLLIILDKDIASTTDKKDAASAFLIAPLLPELFSDAVKWGDFWYFQPRHFQPLVEFLKEDLEDYLDHQQYLKDFRAGKCESCVAVIDRLIREAKATDAATAAEELQDAV